MVKKLPRVSWVVLLAVASAVQAFANVMPPQLYMLGYNYAHSAPEREHAEVKVFKEGSVEPVVVWKHPISDSLHVSINGKTCATTVPEDMQTQILLGLIPVLFSADPRHCVVVGLGAGITAGAVTLSDAVEKVEIVELEAQVEYSARAFAKYNHDVMENPKVRLIIDDGRHFLAASRKKFGVITSDPVDPWMAGAAALYTVEHFRQCRNHLADGGIFMQWLGLYELDKPGLKSILAAFAEAFPDGDIWITPADLLLVGSTSKIRIDVQALRKKIERESPVAAALHFAFMPTVEDLLGSHLCSVDSMKEFLRGSPVNRDGNLYVQFAGGARRSRWNHPVLQEMMVARRKWEPDKFIVPPDRREELLLSLQKRWEMINRHAEMETRIFQQRQEELRRRKG